MGLFNSKKKIYVSSVVYNLAGEVQDRPDYLKSAILGNLLTQKRIRIADTVQNAYLAGTGIRWRSYHRWARENYKQVGISTDRFVGTLEFDPEVVRLAMLDDFGITASIDWIDNGVADISMWGRQWMRENMPAKEPLDVWTTDFIEATGEGLINFTDGTAPVVFDPLNYRRTGDWLYVSYSRQTNTNRWSTPKIFIYEKGTGSAALDAQWQNTAMTGEYLPHIPLRHESKFISEDYKPEVYAEAKKAYKKAFGGKYDELIDKVKDNPDIGEIDYAYVVLGVSFNTHDMASRRYMFQYFEHLMNNQVAGSAAYASWNASRPTEESVAAWVAWKAVQNGQPTGAPITGPAPARPTTTSAPTNSVMIEDKGVGKTGLKMEMTWNVITKTVGAGLGKEDAKVGEVWFTFAGAQEIVLSSYSNDEIEDLTIDTVEAYWQKTPLVFEKLEIKGMVHRNHIYEGKYVEITAAQALLDDDDSGFIIPIHYGIFREMSLVDATQVSTQNATIVFNCYQIVKKKWWQRGWFKVFIVILVIVLTILYPPAGAAAGAGLLGPAAAVGAALGFSGLLAVIVGTLVNMIAAMILTKIITYVSVKLLGEKIGYIVAAIASFIALNVGSSMAAGESLATSFANIMNPANLLAFTNSVGNAYAAVLNADTMEYVQKTEKLYEDARQQSLELQSNYAENFGYGTALFDPMALTETGQSFFAEDSETFLSRTLLTGSDIAEMGNQLISNFAELTLRNEFEE